MAGAWKEERESKVLALAPSCLYVSVVGLPSRRENRKSRGLCCLVAKSLGVSAAGRPKV